MEIEYVNAKGEYVRRIIDLYTVNCAVRIVEKRKSVNKYLD